MPFNSSTVVFYYNKDAFEGRPGRRQAAQDLGRAAAAGQKLKAAGQECGYTTSWPSWVQLETSAWHNVPYATKDNGFGGLDARVAVNTRCTCATWKTWPSWARHLHVRRSRRRAELAVHQRQVRHDHRIVGPARQHRQERRSIRHLPYYSDVQGAPQNTIIGGASLWVFANKKPET